MRSRGSYNTTARVTITKAGYFIFSNKTMAAMGDPKAVLYAFDEDARKIAFIPTSAENKNAYPILISKAEPRSYCSTGRSFLHHFGVDYSTTKRFAAKWSQGKLEIDLALPVTRAFARL